MNIPIHNIYYLVCYAWNKLNEKDRIKVSLDDKTELVDLFAKILINSTKILLKRGIDHNYETVINEVCGVKGKLHYSETLKKQLIHRQRTICKYDEFSSNILFNRILVTTIYSLIKTDNLNKKLKKELTSLFRMLPNISQISLSPPLFNSIRINRNNQFYGFILDTCRVIYESCFPSGNKGELYFIDFREDEKKMALLFENFVRNFYQIEQNTFKVKRENISWNFAPCKDDKYLPGMHTDITLENHDQKIIIDTKYYKETLSKYYDSSKIKSENLYQLFSYLLHQRSEDPKTQNTKGILLYPTINEEYNLNYTYENHPVQIKTINLNTNWANIDARLKNIIHI